VDDGGDHQLFVIDVDDTHHRHPLRPLGFQTVRGFDPGHPT
jgi:hypothetical protein